MKRKLHHFLDLVGDRTARRAGRPATVLAACLDSASSGRTPGVVSGMTRTTEPGAHRVGVAAEGVRTGQSGQVAKFPNTARDTRHNECKEQEKEQQK